MAYGYRAKRRLKRMRQYLLLLIFSLFGLAILVSAGKIPENYLPLGLEWGVAIGAALLASIAIGHVLALLTGDLFERKVRVWRISVPLFPLIVLAVKWYVFGL